MDPSPTQPGPPSLDQLESKDAGLFRLLKAEVDSLREMAKRTQVKGLRECVDQVYSIIGSIESNNAELRAARIQQAGSKLLVVDAKKVVSILHENMKTVVNESNKTLLDAIESAGTRSTNTDEYRFGGTDSTEVKAAVANLQTMLVAQDEKISKMAAITQGTGWTEVVKRNNARKKPEEKTAGTQSAAPEQPERRKPTRPGRNRPPAIIVRRGNEQFPELLKTIRNKTDVEKIGTSISRMRETRNGGLLIEVNGGTESAERVRREIEQVMGPGASVRKTESMRYVEILDLDGLASPEEVMAAISRETETDMAELKFLYIRRSFGGGQTAAVFVPAAGADKIIKVGRLRVGLVYTRVREGDKRRRCYKCLAFGHESGQCVDGPDRRDCCRRCGKTGHKAMECTATIEESRAFQKELDAESNRTQTVTTPTSTGKQ